MEVLNLIRQHRILLAVATILILAVFYLWNDISSVSLDFLQGRKPEVQTVLKCKTTHLDGSVLTARKELQDTIRLLIHFNEKPSDDARIFLAENGIRIYPDSWVYEYLVADATVSSLCFADSLPGITGISTGE
ncbi:MAG: hypothetical protein HY422_03190 [Candidatus Komeilibacteria bacterium]|nr:hypothetical protein [Candidatus Komeilibacteria bacterium]